ncbi:MAG: hypothetical protein IJR13_07860 [Bacteroidales bacterium]|nr:hypothetical protein [Bacteroidales bacterium]
MNDERLMPMSRISDSNKRGHKGIKRRHNDRRAFDILIEAQNHWTNMSRFRRERERNKRYVYGDQWMDTIDVDGQRITEEEYIRQQGNVPLKNNMIRRLVNTVIGVYRSQSKEPICTARDRDEQKLGETMSTVLQYNMQLNRLKDVYARTMEEFLIGGLIVHRKWYGWRNDKLDCWTDYINPNNFFIDSNMRDFRCWDCSFVGEIHDISFASLCQQFAHNNADCKRLAEIYRGCNDRTTFHNLYSEFGYSQLKNYDFFLPFNNGMCRVIEVWRKESKARYRCHDYNSGEIFKCEISDKATLVDAVNSQRLQRGIAAGMQPDDIPLITAEWFIDNYWYYYFLSPTGDILDEGETPYEHKSHPYVFRAYPYIDGEIHSFANDVIDQQRYTNRLITMYDWVLRSSAKGVLLVPEDAIPRGMDVSEFADEWSRTDGVIIYQAKPGVPTPQQVAANTTNIGISELLNLQIKFFEDISGVNGALQGKQGWSGMSAALYSQQTQNATTSLLDILESFSEFVVEAAYKDVKNIQQYYDQKRVFNIAGRNSSLIEYDPAKIRDIEFDLSIVESTATPVYRAINNEFLMKIWESQQISLQQLLEFGDFPFADALLQSLKSQQEQMEQGQQPEGISPELMRQMQQNADMNAVNRADQLLKAS